jgi:hypothetical protein
VRRNPVSRKRGFSKGKLAESLRERSIGYIHLVALGVPNALRQQLRERAIDVSRYFDEFRAYLVPRICSPRHRLRYYALAGFFFPCGPLKAVDSCPIFSMQKRGA